MIRRLIILLLIVGCEEVLEPEDCADGVEYNTDSFVGTYTQSSYTEYQTSDCTGQGEEINILEAWGVISITLLLESTGIVTQTVIGSDDTFSGTMSWIHNGNEVTIANHNVGEICAPAPCDEDNNNDDDIAFLPTLIFSDDTLTLQSVSRDDGNCNISVFTKIN